MKHLLNATKLAMPSIAILIACGPTMPQGGTGGSGGGGTGGSNNAFCNVQAVLQQRCQSCHSNPPVSGAPFPLVTYADTQANAPGTSTPIWQRMQARVTARTMPPAGFDQLSDAQYNTLVSWFNGGARGSECGSGGGEGGYGGIGPLPCTVTHSFKAHAAGNVNAKYNVPAGTSNVYKCFTFRNPMYGTNEIITAARPAADNLNVVHHFILFGIGFGIDGAIQESGCVSPQLGANQLEGWAPGGTNDIFPDDIGTRIEDPFVTLQVHYNTATGGADASGIEYCTTTQSRPNIAKVVTLGTDNISIPSGVHNFPVSNTCTGLPILGSPVYVIGTSAHMHKHGSGFTTQVVKNGDLLTNIPNDTWSFDRQLHYRVNRYPLNPGDQLRTTCYYNNTDGRTVTFGTNTENEMCYDFMMVYPAAGSKTECGSGITFSSN